MEVYLSIWKYTSDGHNLVTILNIAKYLHLTPPPQIYILSSAPKGTMATQCPKCEAENPDTQSFCGDCGTQLISSKDIPAQTKTLVTPPQELSRGTTIAGRYEIIEQLGTGGMGSVYRVEDTKIHEDVALKLIKPEIAADKKTIERFNNELKLARKIRHKNICGMYDLGEAEGTHFITMEYVPGEDLKSFMRRAKQLSIPTVISIAKQICGGLEEAHKLGIVHRDLKPSNIMIDKDGNVHIMDFGIARSVKTAGITGTGVMIGTPEYMSPEQVESKEVDQLSDLYSLGVILYEMVTGRVPFEGETPLSIARKHADEDPSDPKTINPQIPDDLSHLILKCLEKDKENRYQSAGELITELGNIEKGIPSTAREIPKRKPITSKEITVTLGLKKFFIPALIVLVLAVIAFIILRKSGPDLDPNRIVVAIFDNKTGDPEHDVIGHMAADWITQGLDQTGVVEVVPSMSVEKVFSGYTGEDPIGFLAQKVKAGTVISGAYYLQGDSIQFHVQVTDARKGKLLKALDPVTGPIDDPSGLIEALRQQLMVDLSVLLDPAWQDRAEHMPPSYEAYKEYTEGIKCFSRNEFKQATDHFLKAASLAPDFARPKLRAATAYMNLGDRVNAHALIKEVDKIRDKLSQYDRYYLDYQKASIRGDLFGAYQAWVQIARMTQLPRFRYVVGQRAQKINRPQEAVDLITPVDPVKEGLKNWDVFWWDLTNSHHMLGNHKQELKEARRGRKLLPDDLFVLYCELRALAALGKIKEIEESLEESLPLPLTYVWGFNPGRVMLETGLVLRAHGHKEASLNVIERAIRWLESRPKEEAETESHRLILGRTLYYSERWEESQSVFESLHQEFPDEFQYLGYLGTLAARKGEREKALSFSSQLESTGWSYPYGYDTFWRAKITALLGDKEQAVRLLREAHDQGVQFMHFHHVMDLEPLYDYPPFQEFMKPKG